MGKKIVVNRELPGAIETKPVRGLDNNWERRWLVDEAVANADDARQKAISALRSHFSFNVNLYEKMGSPRPGTPENKAYSALVRRHRDLSPTEQYRLAVQMLDDGIECPLCKEAGIL